MSEKGTSVLSKLTAEVMAEKKTEVRKLTPVAGEAGTSLTSPSLPNDIGVIFSNEQLREAMGALRRYSTMLTDVAEGIAVYVGDPVAVERQKVRDTALEQKLAEKEADRQAAKRGEAADFNAAFKAKQEEAQAATFEADAEGEPDESPALLLPVDYGWVCPDHGKAANKTSPQGRQYVGCPDCNKFKR